MSQVIDDPHLKELLLGLDAVRNVVGAVPANEVQIRVDSKPVNANGGDVEIALHISVLVAEAQPKLKRKVLTPEQLSATKSPVTEADREWVRETLK